MCTQFFINLVMHTFIETAHIYRIDNRIKNVRIDEFFFSSILIFCLYLIIKSSLILNHNREKSWYSVTDKIIRFICVSIYYTDNFCPWKKHIYIYIINTLVYTQYMMRIVMLRIYYCINFQPVYCKDFFSSRHITFSVPFFHI